MTLTPEERVTAAGVRGDGSSRTDHLIAPEEVLESERGSLVTGMVIARAWRDAEYRDRLLSQPREVLVAAGLNIPDGIAIRVFEDTPEVRYVALTSLTSEPEELLPLLRERLPLANGSELRLIQNTGQALCLVVPLAPAEPELLTDVEKLRRLVPRASAFASGDVVQSMAQAFGQSEASLEGSAEASAQSSTFASSSSSATASGSDASAAWLANTEAVVNDVAAVNFADVALAGFEAEAASTTTTAFAETQVGAITFALAASHVVTFGTEAEAVQTTTTAVAEAEVAAAEAEAAATTTTALAEAEVATAEAEAVATTTTLVAEAEVAAVEVEAAATTTTAAAEAEVAVAAVEVEAAATSTTVAAEAEAVAVVAIVLT